MKINSLYSYILGIVSIAALTGSLVVIFNLDPQANIQNILWFYLATSVFVWTSSSFVLFFFRQKFGMRELVQAHFLVSIRQGFWIALLYAAGMFLQSKGLFTWLNASFLFLALIFLESYFVYRERRPQSIQ